MDTITNIQSSKLASVLKLMRVHQWIKNLFLFVPVFFAGEFMNIEKLLNIGSAFLVFSIVASSVYILNDYMDIEKDRLHPVKRNRPLASGAISASIARVLFLILLTGGLTAAFMIDMRLFLVVLGYFLMNVMYSLNLKHIAIVDISVIAIGFLFRVYAGGFAANVLISKWLIMLTFLLALMLALAKRRDEVLLFMTGKQTRKSITGYNLPFINVCMSLVAGITIVSYIMYTVSPEVVSRLGNENIFLTTIFVVLGIMRYLQQTLVFEQSGSPTKVLLKDRFIQLILLAWVMSFVFILYWPDISLAFQNLGIPGTESI